MRRPGIKPGSRPWQGRILSLYYRRLLPTRVVGAIFIFVSRNYKKFTQDEIRTRDFLRVKQAS